MRTRAMRRVTARYTWDRLRVSFWFVPAIMAVVAILLARAMYWLDVHFLGVITKGSINVAFGSISEIRGFLLNIATTILTVTGIVFTLITLPLSTVATQYGSRLLRVFLSDRTTQVVLGMFVGTFVYCIAAAAIILPEEIQPEAPEITTVTGFLLMLITFGCLVILIQHISTMLQAPNIAAFAGAELMSLVSVDIPELLKDKNEQNHPGREAINILMEEEPYPVCARKMGYIQYIDPEYLLTLASGKDLVIRLVHNSGHFVSVGTPFAQVWPAGRVSPQVENQIHHALQIGNQRTPTQDVKYAVNQLVEMAVRAMSPAINDPFTAMTCLDYLGNGLAIFARQGGEYGKIYDHAGHLRVVFEPVNFKELLNSAFEMLRHASNNNVAVLNHMLDIIGVINRESILPETRQELLNQVCLIRAESQIGALIEQDKQAIYLRAESMQEQIRNTTG